MNYPLGTKLRLKALVKYGRLITKGKMYNGTIEESPYFRGRKRVRILCNNETPIKLSADNFETGSFFKIIGNYDEFGKNITIL